MAHHVFISFSFKDQDKANKLYDLLTESGISCWICQKGDHEGNRIPLGEDIDEAIYNAITDTQLFVLLQTDHSVLSAEVFKEFMDARHLQKKIVRFRADDSELPDALLRMVPGKRYFDGRKPELEERIAEFAAELQTALDKIAPATDPTFGCLVSSHIKYGYIFFGRDSELKTLEEAFAEQDVVFLHGIGGIGKSELAAQYWRAHKEQYTTVVFARYEDDLAALLADDHVFRVQGVARKTKADNTPQTDLEYAREKLQIMKQHADGHTLIILDNFDVQSDPLLGELADVRDSYRLLVTTRYAPESGRYCVVPVGEIADEDLKKMFIAYADPVSTPISEDDPGFAELFELTDRHTLTLELIAKYMDEKGMWELGEMLELLRESGVNALADSDSVDRYEIIKNMVRLASLSEEERTFLRCLAMMPPSGVNVKLFRKWCGKLYNVYSRLAKLSLIKLNGASRTIALHPIIREVVREELKPSYSACREVLDRAALIGEDAIPIMWAYPYEEKKMYLDVYRNLVQELGQVNSDNYPLFSNMSIMFNYIGGYAEAMALHDRIYRYTCQAYGEYSKESMLVVNRIGWKNSNFMRYDIAIEYYKKVADWFIAHPDYRSREAQSSILTCSDVYSLLYKQTGDRSYFDLARQYIDAFLAYGEKMFEVAADESEEFRVHLKYQNDTIVRILLKLALAEGQYEQAEQYVEKLDAVIRGLAAWEKKDVVSDFATVERHAGELRLLQGRYREAAEHFKRACEVHMQFFSTKNARILPTMEKLAQCHLALQEYDEAQNYITQATEIARAIYTADHPFLAQMQALQAEANANANANAV